MSISFEDSPITELKPSDIKLKSRLDRLFESPAIKGIEQFSDEKRLDNLLWAQGEKKSNFVPPLTVFINNRVVVRSPNLPPGGVIVIEEDSRAPDYLFRNIAGERGPGRVPEFGGIGGGGGPGQQYYYGGGNNYGEFPLARIPPRGQIDIPVSLRPGGKPIGVLPGFSSSLGTGIGTTSTGTGTDTGIDSGIDTGIGTGLGTGEKSTMISNLEKMKLVLVKLRSFIDSNAPPLTSALGGRSIDPSTLASENGAGVGTILGTEIGTETETGIGTGIGTQTSSLLFPPTPLKDLVLNKNESADFTISQIIELEDNSKQAIIDIVAKFKNSIYFPFLDDITIEDSKGLNNVDKDVKSAKRKVNIMDFKSIKASQKKKLKNLFYSFIDGAAAYVKQAFASQQEREISNFIEEAKEALNNSIDKVNNNQTSGLSTFSTPGQSVPSSTLLRPGSSLKSIREFNYGKYGQITVPVLTSNIIGQEFEIDLYNENNKKTTKLSLIKNIDGSIQSKDGTFIYYYPNNNNVIIQPLFDYTSYSANVYPFTSYLNNKYIIEKKTSKIEHAYSYRQYVSTYAILYSMYHEYIPEETINDNLMDTIYKAIDHVYNNLKEEDNDTDEDIAEKVAIELNYIKDKGKGRVSPRTPDRGSSINTLPNTPPAPKKKPLKEEINEIEYENIVKDLKTDFEIFGNLGVPFDKKDFEIIINYNLSRLTKQKRDEIINRVPIYKEYTDFNTFEKEVLQGESDDEGVVPSMPEFGLGFSKKKIKKRRLKSKIRRGINRNKNKNKKK